MTTDEKDEKIEQLSERLEIVEGILSGILPTIFPPTTPPSDKIADEPTDDEGGWQFLDRTPVNPEAERQKAG